MTIKELYELAIMQGYEDFEIKLQYQDAGGNYKGSCSIGELDVDIDDKTITIF